LNFLQPIRFRHFPEVSDAAARREQVIATGRVFLAVGAIAFDYWGPVRPGRDALMIAALLIGYLLLSIVLWVTLRWRPTAETSVLVGAHSADLLCTTALTVSSRGPDSPFFLFFVFVILAAAYRWGLQGTLLTAGAGMALLVVEAYVLTPSSIPARLSHDVGLRLASPFQMSWLVLQCVYLLMIGVLLGYLAEGEKSLQSEAATTARIISRARLAGGLKAAIEGITDEILTAFGAPRAQIVVEDLENGRLFVWDVRRMQSDAGMEVSVNEIESQRQATYRLAEDLPNWFARRTRAGTYGISMLVPETKTPSREPTGITRLPSFLEGCANAWAVRFRSGGRWQGWFYLLDGATPLNWRRELGFLQRVVDASGPVAYNAYLVSRVRSEIGAQERGRVARELHDGAIQSLLSAELQVHSLRGPGRHEDAADLLARVETLVHEQVLNLRELMEKIRPIDSDPRRLPEFLAEQVEKFQRETGIEAVFSTDGAQVRLTGRACRELVRIAQELLFNVRRHSEAARVELRLTSADGVCQMEVSDNGRGFDFSGRFDQAALEAMRKGPRVVQERVRTLGGWMAIESHPGKGAKLEICVPQRKS
jgi:signal transduction histidine kinase